VVPATTAHGPADQAERATFRRVPTRYSPGSMAARTASTGTAADRLRDIEAITDSGLGHLGVEELLVELLDRTLGVLSADTAAVLLLDDSGTSLVATAARGLEEEVYQAARIPLGRGFAGRIAAERRPVVIDDIETADVVNPVLRAKGLRSLLGVPLMVPGRVLGVLHVGTLTPRRFTEADIDLLRLVGERVALATHAQRADVERRAATTLQRSLLPDRLPEVPGLESALRYSAGGHGDAGGDWYDMFVLPSRWVCITVGDVVGRGLHAAVIMGRLRSALRSYALASPPDPAVVLERVDRKLQHFEPGEMATAVVALIEPSLERVHLSLAGHPAPVLARAADDGAPAGTGVDDPAVAGLAGEGVAGAGTYLALPVDPPLGVTQWRQRRSTVVDLRPGSVMALYTDGLVERRNASMVERLHHLCTVVQPAAPEDVCIRVMAELIGHEAPLDDVALLVLRRSVVGPADPLEMTLRAIAPNLGDVRAALRRWLAEAGASRPDAIDILLAVGEATSNVVEHAYGPVGGDMTVRAELHGDDAVVTVADRGRWRRPRGTNRGRGSGLIAAASDDFRVERAPEGTTVTIRRRLAGRSGLPPAPGTGGEAPS
jgi:anti-sigma regulatory factor (Ser/Thr protein kinase)/putative methionine-R-sulfoxide reductase with GAF domain